MDNLLVRKLRRTLHSFQGMAMTLQSLRTPLHELLHPQVLLPVLLQWRSFPLG